MKEPPDYTIESCGPAEDVRHQPWRCGSQVGRTLYVDHGEDKDPSYLFGLVDTPELAAHIVRIHNWWLGIKREADKAWGDWQTEHPDGREASGD